MAVHICWSYRRAWHPSALVLADRNSSHDLSLPRGAGYVVPMASHPAVTGRACIGRPPPTERRVSSPRSAETITYATSCRTYERVPFATVFVCTDGQYGLQIYIRPCCSRYCC